MANFKPLSDKPHINREFFEGHKHPIIFTGLVGNSQDLISVDEVGQIFLWKYHPNMVNNKGNFKPTHKYRVSLSYRKFVCESKEEVRSEDLNKRKNFEKQFSECLDYRQRLQTDGHHLFIVPGDRISNGMDFLEVSYNSRKHHMKTMRGTYFFENDICQFGRIRMSKDKKILGIELIKDHVFGDEDFKTIEIVFFKASLTSMEESENETH